MYASKNDELNGLRVTIIGAISLKQRLLAYYLLVSGGCKCSVIEDIGKLPDLSQDDTDVILWDVFSFEPPKIIRFLKHYAENIFCAFGLLDMSPHFGLEAMAIRLKVKGFFYKGDNISQLPRGISQMNKGNLWIPREILEKSVEKETFEGTMPQKRNSGLTLRQKEVLRLLLEGYDNRDIAGTLNIRTCTVRAHLYHLYKKINVSSRLQATNWAESNLI